MIPPQFATWLLLRLSCRNEALAGDLREEFQRRPSKFWYWRQVLVAITVNPIRTLVLIRLTPRHTASCRWWVRALP